MDGPAVLATPSLDIKSSNDLDDLVLELDEADINGPDSSTDGNDSKDDMKVQDSPPLKKPVRSLSDEPSSECEDPGMSENSSMDIQEGLVNTETHTVILNTESNLEHSENINSIEKEISKANVEAESSMNSGSNTLHRVNLEIEKPAVTSSDKPEVSESLTKMGDDNYESVDQELDDLLNIDDGDRQSSSNVIIKSENEESDNETSHNINAVRMNCEVFEGDDIVIKSEEMIDDVINDNNEKLSVDETVPSQDKKIESVEEPMEVCLDVIKMEDLDEPVEGDIKKPTEVDLDKLTDGDLEKPTEDVLEEPTEDVSEKPTVDVSEKPTVDVSEKPTVDVSVKPMVDVSEKPTEEVSEKSTEDISENVIEADSWKPAENGSGKPTENDSGILINEEVVVPKENGLKDRKEKGLAVQVDENAEKELVEGMEGRTVKRMEEKNKEAVEERMVDNLKKKSKKGLEKGVKQNLKKITEKSYLKTQEKEQISDDPMDEDFSIDGCDSLDSDDFLGGCSDEQSKDSTNSKSHETESGKVNKHKGKNKRLAERDFNDTPKKKRLTEDEVDKMVNDVVEKALKVKRVNGFKKDIESDYSSDDSVIEVNENKGKKKKYTNNSMVTSKKKSIERPDIYLAAREKLAAVKDLNSRPLTVDGNMLEEMVMLKVVEYLAIGEQNEHRMDYASLMKKCSFLESTLLQVHKKSQDLTKQVEDCKHIIKKLIEERVTNKPCLVHTMPLRVTRSVGLQVCTVGSVNMVNSRTKDLESVKKLLAASNSKLVGVEEDSKDDLVLVDDEDELDDKADKGPLEKRVSDGERTQVTSSKPASQSRTPSTAIKLPTLLPKPIKNASTPDSSSARKDSSPGEKVPPKVSACIDLTDNDDTPEKTDKEIPKSSQPKPSQPKPSQPMPSQPKSTQPSAGGAVKPPTPKPPSNCAEKLNGETKTPSEKLSTSSKMARKSTTGGINKNVSPAGADLVSSYAHLPKLPPSPKYAPGVSGPPKPILRIGKNNSGKQGIMLSWNFEANKNPKDVEEYQLFAFQETKSNPDKNKNPDTWKKVGDIKALPLPMACFLTQFVEGHKYHFIVRAVDTEKKVGEFSMPGSIILQSSGNLQATT